MNDDAATGETAERRPPGLLLRGAVVFVVLFLFLAGSGLFAVWAGGGRAQAPIGLFLLACAGGAGLTVAVLFALRRLSRDGRHRGS